jgi:phosphate transport system protein
MEHTVRSFDADLRNLSRRVAEMGSLAQAQVSGALRALERRDAALARQIITADNQIDAMQREIEESAVQMIARRQPLAIDLRQIVGALRIAGYLERVADLSKNIAKRTTVLTGEFPIGDVMPRIQLLGQKVLAQLDEVLRSLEGRDGATALEVWRKDEEIDALNNSLSRDLFAYMTENPRSVVFCTHLLFCAKNLERMGDHATNIAERVYYIVEGQEISGERPKEDLRTA